MDLSDHLLRMEDLVKLLFGKIAQFDAGLFQGDVLLERQLRGLCRVLIADVRVERRDEHKRVVKIVVHLLLVGLDSIDAVILEGYDGLCQKTAGLEEIVSHNRHEDVQFKVALGSGHANCDIVADNLYGNHGDLLALGRVDFAGHDGGTGLVGRDRDFTESDAGTAGQPADIVGNLHHVAGKCLDGAVRKDHLIFGGQRMELVLCGDEIFAGQIGYFLCDFDVEALRRIEAGADCGSAERKALKRLNSCFQQLDIFFNGRSPAADFLGEGNRHSVLKMRTAGFYDALVFLLKALEFFDEVLCCRDKFVLNGGDCCNMARLLQIDVKCVAKFAFVRGNLSKRVFAVKHTGFYPCTFSETGQRPCSYL